MKLPALNLARTAGALFVLIFLNSCAVTLDPRYPALAPHIETNPSPTAIEGMWHSKVNRTSYLFKSDGNLYAVRQGSVNQLFNPNALPPPQKYQYTGNGVWRYVPDSAYRFQMAKGQLIETFESAVGDYQSVYDRQ